MSSFVFIFIYCVAVHRDATCRLLDDMWLQAAGIWRVEAGSKRWHLKHQPKLYWFPHEEISANRLQITTTCGKKSIKSGRYSCNIKDIQHFPQALQGLRLICSSLLAIMLRCPLCSIARCWSWRLWSRLQISDQQIQNFVGFWVLASKPRPSGKRYNKRCNG